MQLNLSEIIIHNFMSFEDADITLNDNGFVFVSGTNNNPEDNATSNGSGKSSIWEAISFALTGNTLRGTKDVQRYGSDTCFVELSFSFDGNNYKIKRTKSPSNLFIYVNGKDMSGKGVRDTEKLLQEYFPDLTENLINSVIILGQGLPQRFTNNTPAGRKEILEKLSKSDYLIADIKSRIEARAAILSKRQREKEDDILKLNTLLGTSRQERVRVTEQLDKLNSTDISGKQLEAGEIEDKIIKFNSDIEELTRSLDELNTKLDELNQKNLSIIKEESDKVSEVKSTFDEDLFKRKFDRDTYKREYDRLIAEIKKLESIKDVCPTCGQKLVGVHKPDTTEKKQEAEDARTNYLTISEQVTNLEKDKAEKVAEVENSFYDAKRELSDEIYKIKKSISDNSILSKNKSQVVNRLKEEYRDIIDYINKFDDTKKLLENNISELDKNINKIGADLLYNNSELNNIKAHVEVINKFSTAVKRDFRGYLLSNVIEFINSSAKKYCYKLFETDNLEFKLDGNNISISYTGKEYENLSGGEKQKIDLCIQFSLRDMLCKFLDFSCNILVLDEITDNLDEIGCQKVIDLISSELNDINSVYIISHRRDLSIPYDRELLVEKDSRGVSKCMMT